jgi:hypothetical protein
MLHAAHVNPGSMQSQVLRNGTVQTIAYCIICEAQFERHVTVAHESYGFEFVSMRKSCFVTYVSLNSVTPSVLRSTDLYPHAWDCKYS